MPDSAFRNKVCIVTGAASGLGREIGKQLAASGASVLLADRDAEGLTRALAQIVEGGGTARAVTVDVTDAAAMQNLIEAAAVELGRIDYLFNNAGVAAPGEIRDLKIEDWRRVVEVNLLGVIHGIHHAYPVMIRQGFGHIVNTASGFGLAPGPLNSPYVASKFAVVGLSHALAAEARAFGVDVSIVCPGYIDTAMIDRMSPANADGAAVKAQIPVKLVPVARAAQIILAGVAKKRRVIAFPGYVRLLAFLHRFVPPAFSYFSAQQIAQFRAIRTAQLRDEFRP